MVLAGPSLERGTIEAIAGLVAIALERARFLREVSRTEALRQSDELKSALLASVSHGLRTPLTSIRAAVDSLLQHDLNWDKEALKEFHLIISEEVHRLSTLVGNLLEMARIEAGELQISKEWGSVSEIFANVIERCAPSFRGHEVIAAASEDLPLVKVDSRLVAEALSNVVENAAKYSPPGSRIVLSANVEAGELVISVADEGPGIATEDMGRIFDKFYRGASTANRPSAGTGMGLAITRGIVEAHGGNVRAESAGGGAKFTISIPVESKVAATVGA
jgi:two-component system sensor histidine kinase KdpD